MTWLNAILGKRPSSSSEAKNRLRLAIATDRGALSPTLLAELKDDIVAVITRRLGLDPANVEVNLSQTEHENRLIAEIPLQQLNHRRTRAAVRS